MNRLRYLLPIIPFIPVFILLIPLPPLFPEVNDPPPPFYAKYIMWPWFISAMFVYPATWVASKFNLDLLSSAHRVLMTLWSGLVSLALYWLFVKRLSNKSL